MSFLKKIKELLFGKTNNEIKIKEIFPDRVLEKPAMVLKTDTRKPLRSASLQVKRPVKPKIDTRRAPEANPDIMEKADIGAWQISDFVVAEVPGKMRFQDLSIPREIMRAIQDAGYLYPTPIQEQVLPESFKGTDVSGRAQTGTGKTAAFLITIFKYLLEHAEAANVEIGHPAVLITAPTRELVMQIEKDARMLGKYAGFNIQSVFGGINYDRQLSQLETNPIHILAATPGRLLDFMEQRVVSLDNVKILVIDEADRMLDMGFIPDMRRIINSTPPKEERQTMLFSATLSPEILDLASQWTKNAVKLEVDAKEITSENIEQRAYIITSKEKFPLIYNIIKKENLDRVIVFCNRRDEAHRLELMFKAAKIKCSVLAGDISQSQRIRTLEEFRSGKITVLAATDVAARGIHIDNVSYVFNYSLPEEPDDYVHRIGRTGRAGASGVSVLFATEEDSYYIPKIEEFTSHKLNYITPEQIDLELPLEIKKSLPRKPIPRSRSTPPNFRHTLR